MSDKDGVKVVKKRSTIEELKALPNRVDRLESIVAGLAEKAGPRLPSIHDACDRCSTQNSGAHLESVWLCEVCRGVTVADKEIISYLRRYIKNLNAAASFALSALPNHSPADDIPGGIVTVLISDLRAFQAAMQGAEEVGDE